MTAPASQRRAAMRIINAHLMRLGADGRSQRQSFDGADPSAGWRSRLAGEYLRSHWPGWTCPEPRRAWPR